MMCYPRFIIHKIPFMFYVIFYLLYSDNMHLFIKDTLQFKSLPRQVRLGICASTFGIEVKTVDKLQYQLSLKLSNKTV